MATARRPTTSTPTRPFITTPSPMPTWRWSTGRSQAQATAHRPLISGFNPCDMYAVDHIRSVLRTFPGVFSGIGEFSIHKEFVAAKIAGGVASLQDPAVDRIFDFAAEVGMLVLIHSDIDVPFAKEGSEPAYLERTKALFRKHPRTTIIWAHAGVGRIVRPIKNHTANMAEILSEPGLSHVYMDISWDANGQIRRLSARGTAEYCQSSGTVSGSPLSCSAPMRWPLRTKRTIGSASRITSRFGMRSRRKRAASSG